MSNPFQSGGGGSGGHNNPGGGGYQGSHRSGGGRGGGGGGGGRSNSNNYNNSNYNSNSNYRGAGGGGGGGGGGQSGGGGGGRGGYRGGGGSGRYDSSRSSGRWNQSSGGRGGGGERGGGRGGTGDRGGGKLHTKLIPCNSWTRTGTCNNPNCHFAHVVQLHATVDASSFVVPEGAGTGGGGGGRTHQQQQQKVRAAVSDVAIWEASGQIKIFTGSYDGFWRLWNAGANFAKEFETKVGLKVAKINVTNSFLFCGMEAVGHAVPDTSVGMVHAWNLAQPNLPPLELQISRPFLPYSHNQCVSAIAIVETTVITGSRDGSIRIWKFNAANEFALDKALPGHAREVTGLVVVDQILWSSSIDGSIRIWDMASGECQYMIPKQSSTNPAAAAANANAASQPQQAPSATNGHAGAITALVSFQSPAHGTFVLSSSLDSTIKAWNGANGECVASEAHNGQGVLSMAIVDAPASSSPAAAAAAPAAPIPPAPQAQQLLLVGLDTGRVVVRNLMQTANSAALEALFVLDSHFTASHYGPVRCVAAGPASTFYTGGDDGNLMVWQINGDLGL